MADLVVPPCKQSLSGGPILQVGGPMVVSYAWTKNLTNQNVVKSQLKGESVGGRPYDGERFGARDDVNKERKNPTRILKIIG